MLSCSVGCSVFFSHINIVIEWAKAHFFSLIEPVVRSLNPERGQRHKLPTRKPVMQVAVSPSDFYTKSTNPSTLLQSPLTELKQTFNHPATKNIGRTAKKRAFPSPPRPVVGVKLPTWPLRGIDCSRKLPLIRRFSSVFQGIRCGRSRRKRGRRRPGFCRIEVSPRFFPPIASVRPRRGAPDGG